MKKMILAIVLVLILLSSSCSVYAQNQGDENTISSYDALDSFILQTMREKHIPGLSASLVIDNTVTWQKAYGFADIEQNISVTSDTLFKIASVSKTITATALMQLYEQGYFDLSDPINAYLPHPVIHPRYPSINITFHMLLTHSSGIIDNWQYLFYFDGDAPIPFQTFLEEYLVPGGEYYDSENNFGSWQPGTRCYYSNIAVALVGYLVEVISGRSFTDYVGSFVFSVLEMHESAWFLRDLNVAHIAMPYRWDGNTYTPYGHIGYVDVPAGDLRTSASQLIHFLTMIMNNGNYKEWSILQSSTVQMMLSPQLSFQPNIGLIFWKSTIGGRTVWGHNGADFGARAMMYFDPNTHIGVIVLSNGEAELSTISDAIFDYAEGDLNSPPETPQLPSGPVQGKINVVYSYICNTTDPEYDLIYYQWDWGDGTVSGWLGPFNSGGECLDSHMWIQEGYYNIRVKAKDIYGAESNFSQQLIVTITGSNNPPNTPSKPTGVTNGTIGTSYIYSANTTDPEGDKIKYGWDWDSDGTTDEWTSLYTSGTAANTSHIFTSIGTHMIKVIAEDQCGAQSSFSSVLMVNITSNAPNKPNTPNGSSVGKPGESFTYQTSTTDLDGDQVYYMWDWGDDTPLNWTGPYNSGQNVTASHVWIVKGTYGIKVRAKDTTGAVSVWSDSLPIKIPYSYTPLQQFLEWLFQRFPNAFPLLRHLMGY